MRKAVHRKNAFYSVAYSQESQPSPPEPQSEGLSIPQVKLEQAICEAQISSDTRHVGTREAAHYEVTEHQPYSPTGPLSEIASQTSIHVGACAGWGQDVAVTWGQSCRAPEYDPLTDLGTEELLTYQPSGYPGSEVIEMRQSVPPRGSQYRTDQPSLRVSELLRGSGGEDQLGLSAGGDWLEAEAHKEFELDESRAVGGD